MTGRERNEMRQHLLSLCRRSTDPIQGPVSLDALLDLAVEAYYRSRPGTVPAA